MKELYIIKIGGNIIDDEVSLNDFLNSFAKIEGMKILIHGGGKLATQLSKKLNIETKIVQGRRITDEETLKVVTMVYAGWINKSITAKLQARNCSSIGLSCADGNCIPAKKRPAKEIDYGFVGDVLENKIDTNFFQHILELGITPVMASVSSDETGQLLNINADTIASSLAVAMSELYMVKLIYCFERGGVLMDKEDENSVIAKMDPDHYEKLKMKNVIADGMIPKLDNAFKAKQEGTDAVVIAHASDILKITNTKQHAGTVILN